MVQFGTTYFNTNLLHFFPYPTGDLQKCKLN